MPILLRRLPQRFAPDTIAQFRAAAIIRNEDAIRLAVAGRGTAAIYLWGYVAEMTLKAAWFELWFALMGRRNDSPIGINDLSLAVDEARKYGIPWPKQGRFHAIPYWAYLLTQHRIMQGCDYADPAFGGEIVYHSEVVYDRWRETLRYKKNQAFPSEVSAVRSSAGWLLSNGRHL